MKRRHGGFSPPGLPSHECGEEEKEKKRGKKPLPDRGAERSRGGDVGKSELHSEFPRFLQTLEEVLLQNKSLNVFFTFNQRSETLFQQVCVCSERTTGAHGIKTLIKLTRRNEQNEFFVLFCFVTAS